MREVCVIMRQPQQDQLRHTCIQNMLQCKTRGLYVIMRQPQQDNLQHTCIQTIGAHTMSIYKLLLEQG